MEAGMLGFAKILWQSHVNSSHNQTTDRKLSVDRSRLPNAQINVLNDAQTPDH